MMKVQIFLIHWQNYDRSNELARIRPSLEANENRQAKIKSGGQNGSEKNGKGPNGNDFYLFQ